MIETGVDIIEIERVEAALARHGERFLSRVFTLGEQLQCKGRVESLAVRFAAKEATFKVLGQRVAWTEVEVRQEASGKPYIHLHGNAAELAGGIGKCCWSVSLSHSRQYAVAVVVAAD